MEGAMASRNNTFDDEQCQPSKGVAGGEYPTRRSFLLLPVTAVAAISIPQVLVPCAMCPKGFSAYAEGDDTFPLDCAVPANIYVYPYMIIRNSHSHDSQFSSGLSIIVSQFRQT